MSELFVDYPVHTRTLSNGLLVVISPDHSVPAVAVNLWYDVGSRDEPAGQTGWAHLFEHLMFQGSAHVSTGEHLQLMQNAGGTVNATTWFDRTNYFETVPTGALDLALWLEADRLASLADSLDEANVETQRAVVKEEKRQRYDNVPYGDVMRHLIEMTFPSEHPYGHTTIGSMADLDLATPSAAAGFFRTHYRPDNAVLSLVGDLTVKDALKKAERAFGWIPRGGGGQRPVTAPLPLLTGSPVREVSADVPAPAVYLSWRLPPRDTPDFDAVNLGLSILGQGQTSRLHQGLIKGRTLAAGASAGATGLIGGNSFGNASARCLPDVDLATLEQALRDEVDRLATSGPNEAELARVKAQYTREWLTELGQLSARADLLSEYATLHRDPGRINRRLHEVTELSLGQVATAVSTWLTTDHAATLRYHQEAADVAS